MGSHRLKLLRENDIVGLGVVIAHLLQNTVGRLPESQILGENPRKVCINLGTVRHRSTEASLCA